MFELRNMGTKIKGLVDELKNRMEGREERTHELEDWRIKTVT